MMPKASRLGAGAIALAAALLAAVTFAGTSLAVSTTVSLSTALSASSASVGGAGVHDTATLTGLAGTTFTGDSVTYTVYPSLSDCTSATGGTSEGSASVSGNGTLAASSTFAAGTPGTYYWQASFNGADHTNAAINSDCSSEALTVTAAALTTALSASSASVGGAGVHDTATLTGLAGTTFTGDSVTYTVYPSLSDCTSATGGTSEGSASVSGNGTLAASNTFAAGTPGTYYWQASFNGADHTNAASTSDCASEALTVTAAALTTALSASSASVGGAGVHDTATLTGLAGTTFTGDSVTYTVYPSLSDCTSATGGTSEGSASVTGNGTLAASNTFAAGTPGTYYWQASFNGADHTNAAINSDCSSEALTVTGAPAPQPPPSVNRGHGHQRLVCFRVWRRGHHHHWSRVRICVRAPEHGGHGSNGGSTGGWIGNGNGGSMTEHHQRRGR